MLEFLICQTFRIHVWIRLPDRQCRVTRMRLGRVGCLRCGFKAYEENEPWDGSLYAHLNQQAVVDLNQHNQVRGPYR